MRHTSLALSSLAALATLGTYACSARIIDSSFVFDGGADAPDTRPGPDVATPDLPTPDLPTPDLLTPDLPAPDLPTPDLPTPDLPTPDLPTPDLPTLRVCTATIAVPTTPGGCYAEDGTTSLCPASHVAQRDAMHPSFRVTHVRITAPAALASPILGNVFNGAVHSGGALWGMTFDLVAHMVTFGAFNLGRVTRGVVGMGLIDGGFHFYAGDAPIRGDGCLATRWNPRSAGATVTGGRLSSGELDGTVILPIFDASGSLLTELPLTATSVTNVQLAGDLGCVGLGQLSGGRFNECSSNWETGSGTTSYGTISAVVTVDNARQVSVAALMTSLCNLLAGANCDTTPMAMWPRQPDAMAGTSAGYRLTAEFAAISAHVE